MDFLIRVISKPVSTISFKVGRKHRIQFTNLYIFDFY